MKEQTSHFRSSRHWRSSIGRSGRSPPPMSSPSICPRSPASETPPGSNSNCRAWPAQNLEISRFCAGQALQLEFEPGGVSEAGDRGQIEGDDIGGGDLPERPIELRQCREDRK